MTALTISGPMPSATVGVPYRAAPNVSGGGGSQGQAPVYQYQLDAPLPVGFAHCPWTGEIIGCPEPGTFAIGGVNQTVMDNFGNSASWAVSIAVNGRTGNATGYSFVTLVNPFGGQRGTTYATSGVVPPQLALIGNRIVAGSTPPVPGQSYSITIIAMNNGQTITQTFTFVATLVAGNLILTGYDGQVITGFDLQSLTGVSP